jgi:ribonuclease T2
VPTDYFMLALSWSPGFCDSQRRRGEVSKKAAFQCAESNHFGWIVHGLWAQSANPGTCEDISVTPPRKTEMHPRYCKGNLPKLAPSEILPYMCMQPGEALLQGEWEKHGACDFDTATQYFEKERELFQALKLPDSTMPKNALFQWMKQHNPQLKGRWLGYEKHSGELRICYSKDFKVIDCQK